MSSKIKDIQNFIRKRTTSSGSYSGDMEIDTGKGRATPLVGEIMTGGHDVTPQYAKIKDRATLYKMWKNDPGFRGSARARVNASVGSGYTVKTYKQRDLEKENPQVNKVRIDLVNPVNGFQRTKRAAAYNLLIYDLVCLETKKKTKNGYFYALDSQFVKLKTNKNGTEVVELHYQTSEMSAPYILKKGEFVFRSMENLGSGLYGISGLEALRDSLNLTGYARQYNEKQFTGGGVPTLAFIMQSGGEDDYKRLYRRLRGTKPGSHLLVKGDIKVEKLGQQIKDMEYKNLTDRSLQETMTVTQTPPIMMAMQGGSQGETDRQAMNAFASEIQAIQEVLQDLFAEAIFNVYGPQYQDVFIKLREWVDMRQRSAVTKNYLNMGAITPNEIRERDLDLPPVPWGDLPYSPNFTPQTYLEIELAEEMGEAARIRNPQFDAEGNYIGDTSSDGEPAAQAKPDPSQNEGNDGNEKPEQVGRQDADKAIMRAMAQMQRAIKGINASMQQIKQDIEDGKEDSNG